MAEKLLQTLGPDAFSVLVAGFIERSEPDTLSFEALDQATQRLAEASITETIELTGVIQDDTIVFDTPETLPVTVLGNEVLIGGLRIVVKLRKPEHSADLTTH